MNCELTPSGRLVDCLPYSYEWVDDVQKQFALLGELLKVNFGATSYFAFGVLESGTDQGCLSVIYI